MVNKTNILLLALYGLNTIGRLFYYFTGSIGPYFLLDAVSWILAIILIARSKHDMLKWGAMILPHVVVLLSVFTPETVYFKAIAWSWFFTMGFISFLYRKTKSIYLSLSITWLTIGNLYDELTNHAIEFEPADLFRLIIFGIIIYVGYNDNRAKRLT